MSLTTIGFDADDTLWHNERFFKLSQARFAAMLEAYGDHATIADTLLETEKRNLARYGFGIKGFTLSMIETAIELTERRAPASLIEEIVMMGREMLAHPIETLPHARDTLERLAGRYRLVLITKGDLFDQERKLAQSGLGEFFDAVEIVSDKTPDVFRAVFDRHGDGPSRAMMVGNSMKSDILPAIEAGSTAVYVPHEHVWEYEVANAPERRSGFHQIEDLAGLHPLLERIG